MNQREYIIEFENVSLADANKYAPELRDALLDASSEVSVEVRRNEATAQDFGGSLVLILGTPAVLAIARAFGDWLRLRNSASITIKTKDGQVIIENLTSKDAVSIADKLG